MSMWRTVEKFGVEEAIDPRETRLVLARLVEFAVGRDRSPDPSTVRRCGRDREEQVPMSQGFPSGRGRDRRRVRVAAAQGARTSIRSRSRPSACAARSPTPGLEPGDVDGFCHRARRSPPRAARRCDIAEVVEYLGLQPRWFDSTDTGGAAFITHAGHAALAIAAGLIDVVVVSYARGRALAARVPCRTTTRNAWGPGQCEVPVRPLDRRRPTRSPRSATCTSTARRREQLAQIAVQCRANAADNPDARYRDPLDGRGRDRVAADLEPARPLRLLRRDRLRRRASCSPRASAPSSSRRRPSTCSASARRSGRSR